MSDEPRELISEQELCDVFIAALRLLSRPELLLERAVGAPQRISFPGPAESAGDEPRF
jgi:hypothetical protein